MAKVPKVCPNCHSYNYMTVNKSKKGFSTGKAVTGAVLFGPLGLVGGGLGKKKVTKLCKKCGFMCEY